MNTSYSKGPPGAFHNKLIFVPRVIKAFIKDALTNLPRERNRIFPALRASCLLLTFPFHRSAVTSEVREKRITWDAQSAAAR